MHSEAVSEFNPHHYCADSRWGRRENWAGGGMEAGVGPTVSFAARTCQVDLSAYHCTRSNQAAQDWAAWNFTAVVQQKPLHLAEFYKCRMSEFLLIESMKASFSS